MLQTPTIANLTPDIIFFNGASISHSSRKKSMVALVSMKSEYIAATNVAQEAVFLHKLYTSIADKPIDFPTKLLTDSEAALNHTKSNVNHVRTDHIDTRFHPIRGVHAAGLIELEHIPASEQAADILKKPPGITKQQNMQKQSGFFISPLFPSKRHPAGSDISLSHDSTLFHFQSFALLITLLKLHFLFYPLSLFNFAIFI